MSAATVLQLLLQQLLRPKVLAMLLLHYLLLVRLLRYRILGINNRTVAAGQPLSTMTVAHAQKVVLRVSQQEFPSVFKTALQFALFRTYGIPSIAALLLDTSLFAEYASASKRYADTRALVTEMLVRDVGGRPWVEAVARLNCIHEPYLAAHRISGDDMLYTLALFAREPVRWIARYEWRALSDVEVCAIGTLWKTIGDGMQIDMSPLGSSSGGGWRDGLHWFEELCAWAKAYEARCMVRSAPTVKLADQVVNILLWNAPRRLRGAGRNLIAALMDRRLRAAMGFAEPGSKLVARFDAAVALRRLALRHLVLPRPWALRYHNSTLVRSAHDTYYMKEYDSLPYYVRPGIWNRWGVGALVRRAKGLPVPGDGGDRYHPRGYRTVDVGPSYGKKGQKGMEDKVMPVGQRKCPLAFA